MGPRACTRSRPLEGPFKEPRCGPRPGVAYAYTPARRQLGVAASGPRAIERRLARLSADANVIIARSGGEANFRISLRWARRER
jgi:hypothetical protein